MPLKKRWGIHAVTSQIQKSNPLGAFHPFHLRTSFCERITVLENTSEKVKVAQSCPTPCDPMDYTVHGILQARILE